MKRINKDEIRIDFSAATIDDKAEIFNLFEFVIRDNFYRDQIDQTMHDFMLEEIENQKNSFSASFIQQNDNRYFKLTIDQTICGVIAYGKAGELITDHLPIPFDMPEIKSVMILPDYHHQGLGTFLFDHLIEIIKAQGYNGYCLDCGYRCSQGFWIKKLSEPALCLKDFWGEGYNHLIWKNEFLQK